MELLASRKLLKTKQQMLPGRLRGGGVSVQLRRGRMPLKRACWPQGINCVEAFETCTVAEEAVDAVVGKHNVETLRVAV